MVIKTAFIWLHLLLHSKVFCNADLLSFFQDSFSEGKEWSNDAEKSALVTEKKYILK